MKWVRYRQAAGDANSGSMVTGRLVEDQVIPHSAPSPLAAILEGGSDTGDPVPLASITLHAPIVPARNVFCVGWNYLPHVLEREKVHGKQPLPDRPNIFTKATRTVIGPFDPVPCHADITQKLDWEVELGIVIGRECVDLSEEEAMSVVAAYTVANDISARDTQHAHGGQWFRGKSLDGSCPIGPWLVEAQDVVDPQNLVVSCSVNGVEKQSANTSTMIFPITRILAELSRGLTLLPGDLILTGTPEGVGQSRTPPEFLQPGDIVESTVEGIGTIRNPIV